MSGFRIPVFLRGEVIEENWVQFGGRGPEGAFEAPDPREYLERLPLATPMDLADLHEIGFDEILDVLEALGRALDFDTNRHLQEAYAAALQAANYPASLLENSYRMLPGAFERAGLREIAEERIGIGDTWMPTDRGIDFCNRDRMHAGHRAVIVSFSLQAATTTNRRYSSAGWTTKGPCLR